MGLALAAAGSLLAAVVLMPLAVRAGARIGAIDRPGHLKIHGTPVPYLGGVAAFVPIAVVVAAVRPALLPALTLALALGVADDWRRLGPIPRLLAAGVVGLLVAAALPLRDPQPLWAVAIVALTVILMNAINLIDGLDALAGGVGLASALGFAVLVPGDARMVALALAGAMAGFLVFNRPPARIYLGDGGAYLLGATLAALCAFAAAPGQPPARAVGAALLVATPLADLGVTVIRRARAGRHLFTGDRGHVYDQLMDRGVRPVRASLIFVIAQVMLAVDGLALARLPLAQALVTAGLTAVGVLVLAAVAGFLGPGYRRTAKRDDDHSDLPSTRLRVHP